MITRTYEALIEIECCRDGIQTYTPDPIQITGKETKNIFTKSLLVWKESVREKLNEKWRERAENECQGVGSRRLCKFYIDIKANEFGQPQCPQFVLDTILGLEGRIKRTTDIKTIQNIQKVIDRLKIQYNC